MVNLFLVLLLLSLLAFILGLIKPSLIKLKSRKFSVYIFGSLSILFFVLVGITGSSTDSKNIAVVPHTNIVSNATSSQVVATTTQPIPPKMSLEDTVKSVMNAQSVQGFGFRDVTTDKNTVTVDIAVNTNVYSLPDASNPTDNVILGLNSGTMTAALAQALYDGGYSKYGLLVNYSQNAITDQYGTSKWEPMIFYVMDKITYQNINWSTFDPQKLCELLHKAHSYNSVVDCVERLSNS